MIILYQIPKAKLKVVRGTLNEYSDALMAQQKDLTRIRELKNELNRVLSSLKSANGILDDDFVKKVVMDSRSRLNKDLFSGFILSETEISILKDAVDSWSARKLDASLKTLFAKKLRNPVSYIMVTGE